MAPAVVCGFDFRPTNPPATRTLPVGSRVAVLLAWHSWVYMHTCNPVLALDHWPVAGLYRSANRPAALPCVTSTSPPVSKVATLPPRGAAMLPVAVNFPAAGLYSSAAAVAPV